MTQQECDQLEAYIADLGDQIADLTLQIDDLEAQKNDKINQRSQLEVEKASKEGTFAQECPVSPPPPPPP